MKIIVTSIYNIIMKIIMLSVLKLKIFIVYIQYDIIFYWVQKSNSIILIDDDDMVVNSGNLRDYPQLPVPFEPISLLYRVAIFH
jgi:hypothetical protein